MTLTGDKSDVEYSDMAWELDRKFRSHCDPDSEIRQIAREEAEKYTMRLAVVASCVAAGAVYGRKGFAIAALIVLLGAVYWKWYQRHTPGLKKELIWTEAEILVRLQITTEAFDAGEPCWEISKNWRDEGGLVHAKDSTCWNNQGKRIYETMVRFIGLSPAQRRKQLKEAARKAAPALAQLSQMDPEFKPDYWGPNSPLLWG